MRDLLANYLKKIGVGRYEDLTSDEKSTFKEWELALQGRQLTEADVKTFLDIELETAVDRLTEVNLSKEDEIFRKVEVRFIKKIIHFLNSPAMEKQLLEKQIESKL